MREFAIVLLYKLMNEQNKIRKQRVIRESVHHAYSGEQAITHLGRSVLDDIVSLTFIRSEPR